MLRIKRLGIDTCHEAVAFLARNCPFYRAQEFVALARIESPGASVHCRHAFLHLMSERLYTEATPRSLIEAP
jgi:hypothetical protein